MARHYVVGIDEVGRGPLAGPITVAAVLAPLSKRFSNLFHGIKDSKKLSAKQREEWLKKLETCNLKHEALFIAKASVNNKIIDRVGISTAARLAVGRCLARLNIKSGFPGLAKAKPRAGKFQASRSKILLDGSLYAPRTYMNQETIIKGDEKVPLIAAASIVAKVARDKKMRLLHKKFPKYGFDAHKGYGTKSHKSAIKRYGPCAVHRSSFRLY